MSERNARNGEYRMHVLADDLKGCLYPSDEAVILEEKGHSVFFSESATFRPQIISSPSFCQLKVN